jgi:homoserine O-acetyltransferase
MKLWSRQLRYLLKSFIAVAGALLAFSAFAQTEGVYTISRFDFEGGGTLDNMKVGYATYGTRAADDGNVIVLVPPTSGLKLWATNHIGPGKAFDPNHHFIVSIDSIGGGTSSQPRDGLSTRFPVYNIRDMVRAQHELLTRGLGIRRALAVGGASSGAYQALEWGVMYPDFARGLLLYAGAAQADRNVKLIVDGIVGTLSLDPAFAAGTVAPPGGDAVRRASTGYFPWVATNRLIDSFTDDELAKLQANFAENWAKNWDAVGLAWRYKSSRLHDVSTPYGGKLNAALERVTAAVLIIPVTTDRTHPIEMSETMRKGLTRARVVYAPLDSMRGHGAVFRPPGTPEYAFVSERTRQFLASLN